VRADGAGGGSRCTRGGRVHARECGADEGARKVLKMVDALEEDDDVQDVVFDVEIPEAVLAEQ
jgi:hypothetical protein